LRVSVKLFCRHPVEQVIHVRALDALNPLSRIVDFRIGLDGCDHSRRIHFHRFCLLDDALQRLSDIALAFGE
jgi:hypothetical protein